MLRQPNLEAQLLISHAELISQLEDEVQGFPEHACCSCERLHQRKSLTRVNLSDELSHDVRPQLKSYILEQTPDAGDHVLFMCKYCRHMIKQNRLPPRCVINGLQVVPMPPELSALDSLINWLYKDIGQGSVDTATQHIIEVSNGSITSVLEKATKDDLAEFQAFTIRNLDNKLSTKSDIEQYKLLSVTEDPIDNMKQLMWLHQSCVSMYVL